MDFRFTEQILRLVFHSGPYRSCTLDEIDACIFAAIQHGKALWWPNDEGMIVGLMTWCVFPGNQVDAFLKGERKAVNGDFANDSGYPVICDFMAPYGHVKTIARDIQKHMALLYGEGEVVRWKRTFRNKPVTGFAKARNERPEVTISEGLLE